MINRRKLFKSLGSFLVFPQLLKSKQKKYFYIYSGTQISDNQRCMFLCGTVFSDKRAALSDIKKQYSKVYTNIAYKFFVAAG